MKWMTLFVIAMILTTTLVAATLKENDVVRYLGLRLCVDAASSYIGVSGRALNQHIDAQAISLDDAIAQAKSEYDDTRQILQALEQGYRDDKPYYIVYTTFSLQSPSQGYKARCYFDHFNFGPMKFRGLALNGKMTSEIDFKLNVQSDTSIAIRTLSERDVTFKDKLNAALSPAFWRYVMDS